MQQENIILDDTIKNNITFNLEENKVDQEKYIMAIKNSNLENYINQLPDKDNTITGENGIQISGGQNSVYLLQEPYTVISCFNFR